MRFVLPEQHKTIATNGINLHAVVCGSESNPLMILLHGFPDFWYGWRGQIEALANAGFYVVAPDQRGYNESDKPSELSAYSLDILVADVVGLIESFGRKEAILVGHDWGGSVSWRVAQQFPDLVRKLIVLNIPHGSVMRKALTTSWRQKLRSSYMFLLQKEDFGEWFCRSGNYFWLRRALQLQGNRCSKEELQQYITAWSQPGALAAMLNWYRALFKIRSTKLASREIMVPALLIWGTRDLLYNRDLPQKSLDLCKNGRLVTLDRAGHWVQRQEKEKVNELMIDFAR